MNRQKYKLINEAMETAVLMYLRAAVFLSRDAHFFQDSSWTLQFSFPYLPITIKTSQRGFKGWRITSDLYQPQS